VRELQTLRKRNQPGNVGELIVVVEPVANELAGRNRIAASNPMVDVRICPL
jgi:hypothetical protein